MAFDPDYVRLKATATVQLIRVSATNVALSTAASYRRIATAVKADLINPVASYVALSAETVSAVVIVLQGISGKFIEYLRLNDLAQTLERFAINFGKSLTDTVGTIEIFGISLGKQASDSATVTDTATKGVGKNPSETASTSETVAKGVGKTLSDTGAVTDSFSRTVAFNRSFADQGVSSDTTVWLLGKSPTETAALSDSAIKGIGKIVSDQTITSEALAKSLSKSIFDLVNLSDSADVQKFTEISSDDTSAVSDLAVKSVGKGFVDSATVNAVGYLRGQDYCDFTYFAEDYVGYSRIF
jgi:hypothetical protein